MNQKVEKKDIANAYEMYTKKFMPKPKYAKNCINAFLIGGMLCTLASLCSKGLIAKGIQEDNAATIVTVGIIVIAQLLTGLGVFDSIAKFAGAGVIVPISGFANSIVAPAIEYKKEGPVLGAGAKMFTVAGPVLVCGIAIATLLGVVYWIKSLL